MINNYRAIKNPVPVKKMPSLLDKEFVSLVSKILVNKIIQDEKSNAISPVQ